MMFDGKRFVVVLSTMGLLVSACGAGDEPDFEGTETQTVYESGPDEVAEVQQEVKPGTVMHRAWCPDPGTVAVENCIASERAELGCKKNGRWVKYWTKACNCRDWGQWGITCL